MHKKLRRDHSGMYMQVLRQGRVCFRRHDGSDVGCCRGGVGAAAAAGLAAAPHQRRQPMLWCVCCGAWATERPTSAAARLAGGSQDVQASVLKFAEVQCGIPVFSLQASPLSQWRQLRRTPQWQLRSGTHARSVPAWTEQPLLGRTFQAASAAIPVLGSRVTFIVRRCRLT